MRVFKIHTKKDRGQDKKPSWPEIGVLFENDKGQLSGYLNNNPGVQVYLFEQKPKEGQQGASQGQPSGEQGQDWSNMEAPY